MRKTIEVGVFPVEALTSRQRLFRALECAFPVNFAGCRMPPEDSVAACIAFLGPGDAEPPHAAIPFLTLPATNNGGAGVGSVIRFDDSTAVEAVLRGRILHEEGKDARRVLRPGTSQRVLAWADDEAVWSLAGSGGAGVWKSALAASELEAGECLRERLRAGRFMALLPLLCFLKQICARSAWREPPLRASIIVDDPNLHSDRYGFIRFAELAAHAEDHDYHVAIATIPFDAWFAHRRAVEIFKRSAKRLSLLIHGNNHVHHELATFRSPAAAIACLAQAQRRIERFEARTGVSVARVVAPPHGACSELAMQAMLQLGFDAVCITRPYPWLNRPPPDMPLAAWFPADFVAGGLPVIPRYHLNAAREDLLFRALLRQPLVLYGHHDDAARGLDVFAEAAALINSFGSVEWCSLDRIARSNYATQQDGGCLYVRCYSNRFDIEIPESASEAVFLSVPVHGKTERFSVQVNGELAGTDADSYGGSDQISTRIRMTAGPASISISRLRRSPPETIAEPPWRPWPLVRRILTEGRDRLRPHLRRA